MQFSNVSSHTKFSSAETMKALARFFLRCVTFSRAHQFLLKKFVNSLTTLRKGNLIIVQTFILLSYSRSLHPCLISLWWNSSSMLLLLRSPFFYELSAYDGGGTLRVWRTEERWCRLSSECTSKSAFVLLVSEACSTPAY